MRRRTNIGFSLIELIVVIAIIATLVAIAMPRYQSSVENAELVALKSNLRVLRESIDRYGEDRGEYPQALHDLVDARYLKDIPVDPITGRADTWIPVQESIRDRSVVVDVRSGAIGVSAAGHAYSDL